MNALHAVALWIHVFGIAIWVGPQVLLIVGWPAASAAIADPVARVDVVRILTRRFAYLGAFGLLLVIGAGVYLVLAWPSYYAVPWHATFFEVWFGPLFFTKLAIVIVMLVVTARHIFVVGPAQIEAMAAQARGDAIASADVARARRRSRRLSFTGLVLTFLIMVLGVVLATARISTREF